MGKREPRHTIPREKRKGRAQRTFAPLTPEGQAHANRHALHEEIKRIPWPWRQSVLSEVNAMKSEAEILAGSLDELRRWFAHMVVFKKAEVKMREEYARLMKRDLEEWEMKPIVSCGCCTRTPDDRRSGVWDAEIKKAAQGQKYAPIEWLWILEVQGALTDEQIADILELQGDDPIEAARAMRRRALGWWKRREPDWVKEYPELAAQARARE